MLRRLIDLPEIADLERKALMNPRIAEPHSRADYPEVDACSRSVFGLTADEAQDVARPPDWDGIERRPMRDQVEAFEREGWDVLDDRRRPLRMLEQFNVQLWLALRGVAGSIPFAPAPPEHDDAWGASMQAQAKRFKRDRR